MKKTGLFVFALIVVALFAVCTGMQSPNEEPIASSSATAPDETLNTTEDSVTMKQIPITITIGEKVLNGYLNDSVPAQSFIKGCNFIQEKHEYKEVYYYEQYDCILRTEL